MEISEILPVRNSKHEYTIHDSNPQDHDNLPKPKGDHLSDEGLSGI
jgi:hypothetical protein